MSITKTTLLFCALTFLASHAMSDESHNVLGQSKIAASSKKLADSTIQTDSQVGVQARIATILANASTQTALETPEAYSASPQLHHATEDNAPKPHCAECGREIETREFSISDAEICGLEQSNGHCFHLRCFFNLEQEVESCRHDSKLEALCGAYSLDIHKILDNMQKHAQEQNDGTFDGILHSVNLKSNILALHGLLEDHRRSQLANMLRSHL